MVLHVSIRAELVEIGRGFCLPGPNGIRKWQVNKIECPQWVTNRSCRAIETLSECTNQIVIALEMTEKFTKYARSRGSFIRNRNALQGSVLLIEVVNLIEYYQMYKLDMNRVQKLYVP